MEGWPADSSPFHRGEQELHARLGISDRQEQLGRRMMRRFMPDQHREFFGQLPFIVLGSVDADGAPWASILVGMPGFVQTPTENTMRIDALPFPGDPMRELLAKDAPVSLLGIELHTRRRNRANLRVNTHDVAGIDLRLTMSFGNCPQYIHVRNPDWAQAASLPPETKAITGIDTSVANLIQRSTTFFVASHNNLDDPETIGGADVNHRGGEPSFIEVDGNTLTIPDYRGNNAFNTLGNFIVNPKAGLLFVDFETGDILQMTGHTEVLWENSEAIARMPGAQRAWKFTFERGHILKKALSVGCHANPT